MFASVKDYQPVQGNEEIDKAEVSRPLRDSFEDGEFDEEDVISLLSASNDPRFLTSKDSTHKLRRPLASQRRRLSRFWILITASLLATVAVLIAVGGYEIYETGPVDAQSPPWYPTPYGGTVAGWEESYKKAKAMVEKMSLVEKVNITTGSGWSMNLCVGNTGPANSVGFPALCLQDGPLGIRFADHATAFPAGITVGATWNRTLMRMRGEAHGEEAKMKGVNVLLGPAMGPLGRNPAGGRVWEGFGSDPVLQGVAAAENIKGIQSQGVIATAKHWVGNEQEHFRKPFEWGLPHALSSNIDDRTLHEIYAWPFAESVRAGVASVMCSYQLVNNSYACGNSALMNGILKDELGFQGFIQSDWLAQRSGVASALAGLDMTMPGDGFHWMSGESFWGDQMTVAALNGSLPMDRVNDMVTRVVAAWYQLGQDSWNSTGPNFSSWTNAKIGKVHEAAKDSDEEAVVNQFVDVRKDHHNIARQVAAEGTVLVKNDDNILPLDISSQDRKMKVAIIGEDAGDRSDPNRCVDRGCNEGTLAVGWGSGASEFSYLIEPIAALEKEFGNKVELTTYLSNDGDKRTDKLQQAIRDQDLCIVFASATAGEGYMSWNGVRGDRNDLDLQNDGDALIMSAADLCPKVIVVVHAVGPVVVERWADLPAVKAIVLAHLPGQESGNALVDVLMGHVDASGRLPYTVGRQLEDYGPGAKVLYYPNGIIPQVDFKEGLYVDYRYFDKFDIEPRYPFGFGLSYTNFTLSSLGVSVVKEKSSLPSPRPAAVDPPTYNNEIPDPRSALLPSGFRKLKTYIYPYISDVDQVKNGTYPYPTGYDVKQTPSAAGGGEGGNPSLFETHAEVTVRVTNTGSRTGQTVIQVYVSFPAGVTDHHETIDFPVKVLRAFEKIELAPGESRDVSMNLTRKDLSYWSVVQQNWVMPKGDFIVLIGQSSRDEFLNGVY